MMVRRRKGKMDSLQISSNYLHENIEVTWYLPEGFTPFNDYQLVFMQDGNDYFQMGRIATLSDTLHDDGDINPTIFVGIHYQNRYDRWDKYHPEGKQNDTYTSFLVKEVLPAVEDELHITPISRALMGDSLAGTFAWMTATSFPSTFQKVIMQSPLVNKNVLIQARNMKQSDQLEIYHSIGLEETEVHTTSGDVTNFLQPNRELNRLLSETCENYIYNEFDGNHTWKYWQQELPTILKKMFR